ncbi:MULTISPECIES: hypothetical protein [Mycobacterium]|jgi:Mce-associated membrane protein|uniref:Mce-associated membrane protein n=1 Tax=Mycobacterium gordonae TaxID=1778 RepID=A0A1A6B9Q3_MYCGO|nr:MULTISPECIES: hypothetical protein [Mycobacterium]MBI2703205.1 hypothetical protein [Mycobacterium sp.]MCQ4363595.1 hypothetical protein [Mycobacterium gordonae]MCV7006762.1 hypothetical protein [Mycobacterium gordonae]OBR99054.1 hypothetical protein A9W98_02505 [Mycobacterium gordonae]ODR22487.1 hypothetical protein BHQ23_08685 [Mycobacterium gordonae]
MAETDDGAVPSKADVLALAEEAEAEAAEAEALAAAARAKARAARLRREALAAADDDDDDDDYEYDESEDYEDYDESEEYEDADDDEDREEYDESENYSEVEPEAPAKPSRRDRIRGAVRFPRLSTIAKLAAVLLILGFIGLSTYFMWQHHEATDREQKAAAFIAGAKKGVVNMTSLDFKKAKEDVQRVIDSSTGEFRDDFQQRAADFTKVVEQSKVVTEGTVNAAAIESMDGRTAQVLVSATSRVTNSAGAKDEPRAWRLRVTVTEEDGQYKMSKVEFVP